MIYAFIIVSGSQFFSYSSEILQPPNLSSDNQRYYGGYDIGAADGWSFHPWTYLVPVMAVLAFLFFTKPRSIGLYWVALVPVVLFGFGGGTGGVLGAISMAFAGYATYSKKKEMKAVIK